ncbi:unnamed protein product [Brassica oleracea var. botrytis]
MFLALSNSGSKPLKMIDFQLLLAQLKADLCTQTVVTRVLSNIVIYGCFHLSQSTLIHTSISVNRLNQNLGIYDLTSFDIRRRNQNFWLWECHVSIRFTEHTKFVELAATINLIPLEMFWFCTYDHYLLLLLLTPIYEVCPCDSR